MGKDKTAGGIDGVEIGGDRPTDKWVYARKLLKLLFGSQSIMFIAIGVMSLAVLNGDAMRYFTSDLILGFNDLLLDIMPEFAYPVSMVIGAMIIIGPAHYYAKYDMVELIIILFIVFFITGMFLGRMFKHPLWAFASGFIVMASFVFSLLGIIAIIDYLSVQTIGISIQDFVFSMMEGVFEDQMETLFIYTVLENGAILGLCGALWGAIFMPGKKGDGLSISMDCVDGGICKI
jgi:hypothetical protein